MASRESVIRAGRVTSRRNMAYTTATSTATPRRFPAARTARHTQPSRGQARTACTAPAVTRLAVPMVRTTKPQKIAACMVPTRISRNMRTCAIAYTPSDLSRCPGRSTTVDGRAAANTRRCRAICSPNTTTAARKTRGASG